MSNSNALSEIYFVVIVLSGKGGVGKSTVACNLALQIGNLNRSSVGVIDLDICGPSVPKIMGLGSESVLQSSSGWIPVTCECIVSSVSDSVSADSEPCPASATAHETFSISVVSIASMLEKEDDAIVWRGPRKEALIQQFIDQVVWPAGTKYLVIDTPPGTSDEHIMVLKLITEKMRTQHRLQIAAVLVSTPQTVSTDDVAKEISFCRKMNLPMIGVVENMTSYTCPHCNTETAIFGQGGCDKLTSHHKIPKLGQLCLNPNLSILQDRIGLLYYWRKNKTPPDGSLTGTRLADAKSSDAEFIAIAKKINHYFATLHNTNIS